MDNDSIKSFIVMAEMGSLSEAAERLFLSPSSLTSRIKKIEKEIGEVLFELSGRTLTLSPAGKVFLSYAKQFNAIQNELNQKMTSSKEEKQRFRIAATPSMSTYILPSILKEFFQLYPDLDITIYSCPSHKIRELLSKDEIDLGISHSGSKYEFLCYEHWFNDLDIMIVSKGHPWASKKEIELAELRNQPLVAYQRHTFLWKKRLSWIKEKGVTPWIAMEMKHVDTIKEILLNDYGYSFLPIHAIVDQLEAGHMKEIRIKDSPEWTRETYFVTNKKKNMPIVYKNFIELAKEKTKRVFSSNEGKLIS